MPENLRWLKDLLKKYNGIACEENYHEALMDGLDWNEFPNLGYTANLKDWAEFIRRTPDEYARWIEDVSKDFVLSSLDFRLYGVRMKIMELIMEDMFKKWLLRIIYNS